jgi:hypothetical protein
MGTGYARSKTKAKEWDGRLTALKDLITGSSTGATRWSKLFNYTTTTRWNGRRHLVLFSEIKNVCVVYILCQRRLRDRAPGRGRPNVGLLKVVFTRRSLAQRSRDTARSGSPSLQGGAVPSPRNNRLGGFNL